MKTLAMVLAASWFLAGPAAKAGELDSEYGSKAKAAASAPSLAKPPGELDAEAPTQAWFHGRRFFGYGGFGFGGFGFGFPGFGFGGFGYGYPAFGLGFGGFGYGYPAFGFGGFYGRGFGYGRRW